MTKSDETVAILDNSLSGAMHYFDDEFHRYLEYGRGTFDLSIAKKHAMYSNASTGTEDDFQYLKENHFLVFRYKNKDYKFKIRRVEETETSLRLFCEDLSFDLINEERGPYKADKAYPISKYVNDCLVDSGYEIGINEFTKNERTLEWEGDQTVLKRLLSICNSFSAEIEFETVLNDDRTVNKQLVHLKKSVGVNRTDIELKYGHNVSSIRRNVDVTELITAIKPRGHEEDGKITTITNVEKEIKDENGNVIFYTKKGSEYIYAPMANQEYGNPKRKGGGYIVGQFSYDTKSDTELFNRALTELEKKCVPAYEFEIEGFYDIDIGDTIRAIDEGYNPILLLEARISEQTISFSDPTKNKTVYSNYRILQNKVSQSLLDRIDEVKKYAEQVAKTYIFSISNVGSPMFRNGEGEVIFTAKIEKNNQDFTAEFTSYNWLKQNKDGSLDTIWNAAHQGIGKSITVKPEDFEDTATFSYEALQDDLVIGGASGVVTKVFDGEDGKTPIKGVDYFDGEDGTDGLSAYLHIKYSQNSNGNPMTSDPTGAKYVGMQVSQNPNPSTVPADYDWTLVKGADGIPGETGADGKTSYLHIKYSNDGGQTFTGNGGEDVGTWMGQYVDFTQADSTDVKKYTWSKIKGEDGKKGDKGDPGNQGIPGTPGTNGKTPYTHYAYAWSADGTDRFTDAYPAENLLKNSNNFERNWSYSNISDTSNVEGYNGLRGIKLNYLSNTWNGIYQHYPIKAGDTLTYSFYAKTTGRIYFNIGGGARVINEIGTGDWKYYSVTGTYNTDETKAFGVYLHSLNPTDGLIFSAPKLEYRDKSTMYTPAPTDDFENAYPTYSGTYTDYTAQDSQNPADYTWTRILGESGQDGKDGVAGKDGVGIKTTTVTYALSDSGTTAPTSGWTATVPTLIKGKYLWTKSVWTYTDASTETGYSVTYVAKDGNNGSDGLPGKDGVGIKSTTITYAVSSSGTTAPSSGWVTNPPAATAGQFMWTRTVWTYTDNSTETGYSVGKIGNNGSQGPAGNGIASTAITYQASASGTNAPTGTWSTTIPNVPAGQFLWTRTVTTYTNNTNSTAYTVAKMGSDGKPGSNGVSVSSVVEEYYVSTSPTSQAGGSWSTTVPNNSDPNKYIWRRLKTTMSDSTVTYTNPALIQGMTGIYPYIGPTQPANPKEGQQWWKSDSSGNITDFRVYKSGSWQGQTIQQSVLNIIELNAVTITGSTITGTKINGGVISGAEMHSGLYTLTYKDAPLSIPGSGEEIYGNGTMIISLGTISDSCTAYKADSTVPLFDAFMQLKHNRIVFFKNAPAPSYQRLKQVEIGYDGLYITNEENFPGYNAARLTFQDLMTIPTTLIPASSGWTQYATNGGNAPMASRQGRVVQLSGAFKNNGIVAPGDGATMGLLPVWARPSRDVNTIAQASSNNRYLLTIKANGEIAMGRHSADGTNLQVGAGSWLNIAITYAAGDL
jgi:phage minor structural protein